MQSNFDTKDEFELRSFLQLGSYGASDKTYSIQAYNELCPRALTEQQRKFMYMISPYAISQKLIQDVSLLADLDSIKSNTDFTRSRVQGNGFTPQRHDLIQQTEFG